MRYPSERDTIVQGLLPGKYSARAICLSFGGSGYLPKAPGTWGTLAAMAFALCFRMILDSLYLDSGIYFSLFLTVLIVAGSFALLYILRENIPGWPDDPGFVVLDEAVGIWIVMLFLNVLQAGSLATYAAGFALFRFFDIRKPYPIGLLNEKRGGFYVLIDDVVAGVYTCLTLLILFIIVSSGFYRLFS